MNKNTGNYLKSMVNTKKIIVSVVIGQNYEKNSANVFSTLYTIYKKVA
jgi:hypothetical protein